MKGRKGKQKEKFKAHIKSAEFYEYYSVMHFKNKPEGRLRGIIHRDSPFCISYSKYCTTLDSINKKLREEILLNSFDFNLPFRMGMLGIRKRKLTPYINKKGEVVNPLPVDWKSTLDLWAEDPEAKAKKKLVRHYNEHTKGFIAEWYYSVAKATFKWKSGYSFIPCRTAKIELSKVLKAEYNEVDYYLK